MSVAVSQRAESGEVGLFGQVMGLVAATLAAMPSLEDHDAVLATVWGVPGVVSVDDELAIGAAGGGH